MLAQNQCYILRYPCKFGRISKNIAFSNYGLSTLNSKLEDNSDASLSAVETAHEGEKVILKVDVDDGYELNGAFNGQGEKVALQKDENGDWYVIVPKGGGVYLSVTVSRIEHKKKDNDDNDNTLTWTTPGNTVSGTYASAEAFGSAGVSMIAAAAPDATVTINLSVTTG